MDSAHPLPATIAFHTLGCRLNTADTQRLEREATLRGFSVVEFTQQASIYVVNTCTVTGQSDLACRRVAKQVRARHPEAVIVAVGCYVQAHADARATLPEVDLLLPNTDKDMLFDRLSQACPDASPVTPGAEELGEARLVTLGAAHRRRAFVKVQEGCDETCSYCIVPKARGASRSRSPEEIAVEIERLVAAGYREMVLVGVHLGDFGAKLGSHQSLGSLLRRLSQVAGSARIRLSSLEPDAVTADFVDAFSHPKVCRHLHLPMQSGSDRILKAMRRPYNLRDVHQAVERLLSKLPDVGLGADFITGFPGETERDFADTYALVEELPLSYLHVFPFSPRPGTEAATLPDQVPAQERDRRVRALNLLGKTKGAEFVRARMGKSYEAWFYPGPPRAKEMLRGLTTNYLRVLVAGPHELINEFAEVRLMGFDRGELRGELVAQA